MPTIRMRSPIRTTCSLPTCPRVVTAASTATRRRHGDSSPLPKRAAGPLYCGSYPITPATVILEELAKRKDLGVKTVQCEDEIAGICTTIGASYAGHFAVTTTSGPGLSLKSEAMGLAVMTELPIVVVDVQRGGPSTGLPTKTEQGDLLQALWGRNGECPMVVIASSTPSDCFHYAFMAGKLAMEHMTPVVLLSDGFIANGSQPWKIPSMKDYPEIHPPVIRELPEGEKTFLPYKRDGLRLARRWAFPGTPGLEHRIGGLEKDILKGSPSHNPQNHQRMVELRAEKVARVADFIPEQEVLGDREGDLLVVGWGRYPRPSRIGREGDAGGREEGFPLPLQLHQPPAARRVRNLLRIQENRGMRAE